jgi:hypothetical protein
MKWTVLSDNAVKAQAPKAAVDAISTLSSEDRDKGHAPEWTPQGTFLVRGKGGWVEIHSPKGNDAVLDTLQALSNAVDSL